MADKFIKNVISTVITRVAITAIGMGISVVIARVLGAKGQGIFSVSILLPSMLAIFTTFGINVASTYFIAKKKYDPKEVLGANIMLAFSISLITILIGLIIIFFFSNEILPGIEYVYMVFALLLIPFTMFFEMCGSILLGLQKIRKYNFLSFLQSFSFLLLILVLLLRFRLGIKAAIFAQILSFAFASAVLFFISKKETQGIIFRLNKEYIQQVFSYGLKIYLTSILNILHYRISLILINLLLNPVSVGLYTISSKLSEGILLISISTSTVLFPKVSSETHLATIKDITPMVCRSVMFLCLIFCIIFFISSHWIIIFLYSNSFVESVAPFQILLIGTLAISGFTILMNDLAGRGKPIISAYITGSAVFLNIVLNIFLIPKFGIKGAAWAGSISYVLTFIVTVFIYSKISGNKISDILILQRADIYRISNFFKSKLNY